MRIPLSLCVMVLHFTGMLAFGQLKVDLTEMLREGQIQEVNRTLSLFPESPDAVEMNAAQSDGLAVLKNVIFDGGTIELEVLGENNPGRSFIGIAFNIQDEKTYEAVYFRPFNFVATVKVFEKHVEVYMKDRSEPVLKVERLGTYNRGKIGLWVGNGSSGRFRNLVLDAE